MEGLSAKVYNGVKCYWRRRTYHRLTTTTIHHHADHSNHNPHPHRRQRSWRVRLNPKLKLKLPRSPRKLFLRLRDAYVRIMMRLANTPVVRGRTGFNCDGFGRTMMIKECDEKIVVQICKDLEIRRNQHCQISSQIACSG